jgi:hypothetical protein
MSVLADEIQETVITNSFLQELPKLAGWGDWLARYSPEARIGREAGAAVSQVKSNAEKLTRLQSKDQMLRDVARRNTEMLSSSVETMPATTATKKKRNLPLIAASLGLGGLGFGYYQYKKNEENQLTGINS